MKRRKVLPLIGIIVGITLLFIRAVFADVSAPPANQTIGIDDGIFNNLLEADCRLCHDDPIVVGPTPNVDRHHLLYGTPLPQGECSVNRNACLSDADCDSGICSSTTPPQSCIADSDCPADDLGETCGEVCIGETVAPILDADQDGTPDGIYSCLSCHAQSGVTPITFEVIRDCLQCHVQVSGEGSVHHLTATAQGTDSLLGDPSVGDCTPCHGTLVDDIGDGHQIPIYNPSLVTPSPSGANGQPLNTRGNGAGACDYCHDSGTDTVTGVQVFTNAETHHNTGVFQSETGVVDDTVCQWCHNMSLPDENRIRTCEGCHGLESLHNIQADSPNAANIGSIVVGGEDAGYGHIGADNPGAGSDCWGCHGFSVSAASAPNAGPLTPYISGSDPLVITAGTDTVVTLTGSAFTNMVGPIQWLSEVAVTAADGVSVILTPDSITSNHLTVTIPGTTAIGNYTVRAVKGTYAESNPIAISIKPEVTITDATCENGTATINGSGFSGYVDAENSGTSVTATVTTGKGKKKTTTTVEAGILFWADNQIEVQLNSCPKEVTVNSVFGSDSAEVSGGGDPPADPEICDDGIDNDLDGKVDCDDKGDCNKDPACKRQK
jgi:hypothetical protein